MERVVIEYLANAFWQLPVLALGAWLLLRMWKPGPAAQHRVWLAVLALGLLLPLRGAVPAAGTSHSVELSIPAGAGEQTTPMEHNQNSAMTVGASGTAISARSDNGRPELAFFSSYLHRIDVSASVALWIVGLWLAVALWDLVRIALAWRAARRLVANSWEAALGERERTALLDCARRVGVAALEVRESDAIAGPVIVGAARPVLLWPENFTRTSADEMRAALFHELAHVRRRDYVMNLMCEIAALPLKWHPATHRVERRIRATREMACDAMAAEAMDSETIYAECLVRLARSIVGCELTESSLAAGLLNGNVMEERVMRLMRGKTAMSFRAKLVRGAAGAGAMLTAIALAAAFHLTPAMAQEHAAVAPVQNTPSAVPSTPPAPTAPAIAAVPPAPIPQTPTVTPPHVPAVPAVPATAPPAQPMPQTPTAAPPTPPIPQIPTVAPPHVPAVPATAPPAPPIPKIPAAVPHHEKPVVMINGQKRELTPAERARIDAQLAEAQKRIAEATAKINSPEFRKKIQEEIDAAKVNSADIQKQLARLNSPEFKKQMADAQKQMAEATARWNSPEFKKQMADAQKQMAEATSRWNSPEFKKQMADAQKQIAAATARVNSPEFKKQMEEAARAAAKVNSAEFQKQMADAQKQLADALARMKAEQEKGAAK